MESLKKVKVDYGLIGIKVVNKLRRDILEKDNSMGDGPFGITKANVTQEQK